MIWFWSIVEGGEKVGARGWEGGSECWRRDRKGRRKMVGMSTKQRLKFLWIESTARIMLYIGPESGRPDGRHGGKSKDQW